MKFSLTLQEAMLLQKKGVPFDESKEYTEDEALDLLDQVREIEVSYAQFSGGAEENLYLQYGRLADKIYAQIPEN